MNDNVIPFRLKRQGLRPITDLLVDVVNELLSGIDPKDAAQLRARFGITGSHTDVQEDSVDDSRLRVAEARSLRQLRSPKRTGRVRSFLDLD
jgi:RNA polymerase primary sigma factor